MTEKDPSFKWCSNNRFTNHYNTKLAILFLDLDKFKPLNDLFGHKNGDRLLQSVAHRIVRIIQETDTVTRLGCDEFEILPEDVTDTKNDRYKI